MKILIRSLVLILCGIVLFMMDAFSISASHKGSRSAMFSERSYVHTDREIYVAGETLFFKIYVVDDGTLCPTRRSKLVYVSLRNENNHIITKAMLSLSGGMACGSMYLPDTLSTGYYQLESFTNFMRNFGESSYSKRELFIANQFDKDLVQLSDHNDSSASANYNLKKSFESERKDSILKVETDKNNYTNHEKIVLSLKIDGNKPDILTSLSISVFAQPPESLPNDDISDFLKLSTKVNADSSAYHEAFVKLKVAGLTEDKGSLSYKYLPECQGQILQGNVVDATDSAKAMEAQVFLSALDTIANLKYADTDSSGKFQFLLDDYYDGKKLNFKVKSNNNTQKYKILFDDKFSFKTGFNPVYFNDSSLLKDYLLKCQIVTRINKAYYPQFTVKDALITKKPLSYKSIPLVYEGAPLVIHPSVDYIFLPDFLEIAQEILPPLRIKIKEGKYKCNFFETHLNGYLEGSPLIFLNGVLLDDVNPIISLNSDQISSIDCVNSQRVLGDLSFDGVLSVITKKKEISDNLTPGNVSFSNGLFAPESSYCSPGHNVSGDQFMPDFRQLLYWNPDIEIKGNSVQTFNFYASDQTGRYIIEVEGITSEGKIINTRTFIDIESSDK